MDALTIHTDSEPLTVGRISKFQELLSAFNDEVWTINNDVEKRISELRQSYYKGSREVLDNAESRLRQAAAKYQTEMAEYGRQPDPDGIVNGKKAAP